MRYQIRMYQKCIKFVSSIVPICALLSSQSRKPQRRASWCSCWFPLLKQGGRISALKPVADQVLFSSFLLFFSSKVVPLEFRFCEFHWWLRQLVDRLYWCWFRCFWRGIVEHCSRWAAWAKKLNLDEATISELDLDSWMGFNHTLGMPFCINWCYCI